MKILVVDDSVSVRKALERILLTHDVEVMATGSAEEALQTLPSAHPDLVIADVVMPGMDGFELCRSLQVHPAFHQLPVLLISGIVTDDILQQAHDAGAVDIVQKPFTAEDLFPKIERALETAADGEAVLVGEELNDRLKDTSVDSIFASEDVFQPDDFTDAAAERADAAPDDFSDEFVAPDAEVDDPIYAPTAQYDAQDVSDPDPLFGGESDLSGIDLSEALDISADDLSTGDLSADSLDSDSLDSDSLHTDSNADLGRSEVDDELLSADNLEDEMDGSLSDVARIEAPPSSDMPSVSASYAGADAADTHADAAASYADMPEDADATPAQLGAQNAEPFEDTSSSETTTNDEASNVVSLGAISQPTDSPPKGSERLSEQLHQLLEHPAVDGTIMVNAGGICLAHAGDGIDHPEALAAYCRSLTSMADILSEHLAVPGLDTLHLDYQGQSVLINKLKNGSSLLLLINDSSAFSVVRYLIRKQLPELEVAV